MNAKKRQLLRNFPWAENYLNLVAFAEWLIQGKSWKSNILPKGQTAETIVQDAIAKTFTEERNWDPERGELLPWLKWVIRSDISHLAESASNRREVRFDRLDDNEQGTNQIEFEITRQSRAKPQAASPEERIVVAETIDLLLEACKGKQELVDIVYAICDGKCPPKPQSLSQYLGKPVEEINQQLRALRRRAYKIRIEAENG